MRRQRLRIETETLPAHSLQQKLGGVVMLESLCNLNDLVVSYHSLAALHGELVCGGSCGVRNLQRDNLADWAANHARCLRGARRRAKRKEFCGFHVREWLGFFSLSKHHDYSF